MSIAGASATVTDDGNVLVIRQKIHVAGSVMLTAMSMTATPSLNSIESAGTTNVFASVTVRHGVQVQRSSTLVMSRRGAKDATWMV